jgi:hypothetical protein
MPRRNSKALPIEANEAAHLLIQRSPEKLDQDQEPPRARVPRAIHRVMSKMGRKGGKIGGKRRLETMTEEARRQVASLAAKARWAKAKGEK